MLRAISAVLVLVACGIVTSAHAQQPKYKQDKLTAGADSWTKATATKEYKEIVQNVVQGSIPLVSNTPNNPINNRPIVEAFLNDTLFPLFTQTSAVIGKDNPPPKYGLAKMHQEFKTRFLIGSSKQQEVHTLLNELTLARMTKIAADPGYHPAVRYQAIYLISDLHDIEPSGFGKAGGIPMQRALQVLVSAASNPKVPYEMRVAALVGVQRHATATATLATDKKKQIGEAARNVINESMPQGMAREQHDWLRRLAAEILVALKDPLPDAAKTLLSGTGTAPTTIAGRN